MTAMKIMYLANIVVAGWISLMSIFFPSRAMSHIFSAAYPESDLTRLVGCLWLGIAVLSVLGLARPMAFSPVFILQLVYKGTWLLVVALPAIRHDKPFPGGMAVFFLVWCIFLPFIIPWKQLFTH